MTNKLPAPCEVCGTVVPAGHLTLFVILEDTCHACDRDNCVTCEEAKGESPMKRKEECACGHDKVHHDDDGTGPCRFVIVRSGHEKDCVCRQMRAVAQDGAK